MTQVRLSSNAPSPQMLPQRRSRLAMSSVRLKLCSTERRDGLWRKNLFMLQAIWQLRPVLSTTLNLGTLKSPLAWHAKCYDLFGPYAVRYNDNGAPDWMQLDVCMRIMAFGQQPALGGE